MSGGLKTGGGYMGLGNLAVGFDTEKARWWRGGGFYVKGAAVHGKSLSEHFSGDLQVASNIDAGTHTYLHELWFWQEFGKGWFTVGLQDLNAEFFVTENGSEFINSSFGMPPGVAGNVPVPIFPLTGLGVAARWDLSDRFGWQMAVFDGMQAPFEENPHNLHWRFGKGEGLLAVTEVHAQMQLNGLDGTYKAGSFYHSGCKETPAEGGPAEYLFRHNYGVYLLADQTVMHNEARQRKIGLFAQAVFSPKEENAYAWYAGLGANYYGIFSPMGEDVLGVAVASVDQHQKGCKNETVFEVSYKRQFSDHFAVQPDLQYILHPSRTGADLPNALIGIIRVYINF